ncbi:MAG: quinone-dependent dihydroorotate dehydrogenase [Sphingomonadales bacterium]
MADLYQLLRPLIFRLPAETAHSLTLKALQMGALPAPARPSSTRLKTRLAGIELDNPFGLAAGFDKNADVPWAMHRMGFGFVEVGTITPRPQAGNPKPRVFRLVQDGAVINRLGFNNAGLAAALPRLAKVPADVALGINVGANKDSIDRIEDYCACIDAVLPYARYLTINISSPNTPGLRDLQAAQDLSKLVSRAVHTRGAHTAPIFVKLSPDMDSAALLEALDAAVEAGADGFIVTNTTLARPASLKSPAKDEAGGLSGAPLLTSSTRVLAQVAKHLGPSVPLIGVGGVASGADALLKIKAGAHAVQLYSALVYHGPGLIRRMAADLDDTLEQAGYASVADAIGTGIDAILETA